MAGFIGSRASVVSSGVERKKVYSITGATSLLTGASYTPNQVHVFHNGVRLVDGTDFSATDGSTISLTTAGQSGDEIVVVSYGTFSPADTYTKSQTYTKTEADGRYVDVTGDTMTGPLIGTDLTLSGGVYLGGTGSANHLDDYEEGTWTPAVTGSSSNPTVTYSDNYGYYTKIGRFVHVYGRIQISSISGGSVYFFVDGLPFTVNSTGGRYATGSLGYVGGWNTVTPLALIAPHGTTRFEMYGATGTSARDSVSSIIFLSYAQSGSDIIFSLSYETT